jgi:carbohydrate kinase (thermoresistant glucokinase family)
LLYEKKVSGEALVLACSALKRNYQEILRSNREDVKFVYLAGEFDLILDRMQSRQAHFMKAQMLASQFKILEPPPDALVINIDQPVASIVQEILKALEFDLDPH